jgi:hypothetical protein
VDSTFRQMAATVVAAAAAAIAVEETVTRFAF